MTPGAVYDTMRALADQIKAWHNAFPERSIASINSVVYTQRHALGKAKLRDEAAAKNTTVAALTEQRYAENARTRQHEDELRRAVEEEYAEEYARTRRAPSGLHLCCEEGCLRFAQRPHSRRQALHAEVHRSDTQH